MSQNSHKYGGLGLGTTGTSYIFLSAILALVIYLPISGRDVIEVAVAHPHDDGRIAREGRATSEVA